MICLILRIDLFSLRLDALVLGDSRVFQNTFRLNFGALFNLRHFKLIFNKSIGCYGTAALYLKNILFAYIKWIKQSLFGLDLNSP